jgi:hypothetical protein
VRKPSPASNTGDDYDVASATSAADEHDDDYGTASIEVVGPAHQAAVDLTYRPERYRPPSRVERAYRTALQAARGLSSAVSPTRSRRAQRPADRAVVGADDDESESLAGRDPVAVRACGSCGGVRRFGRERDGGPTPDSICTRLWGFLVRESGLMTSALGWAPSGERVRENDEMNGLIDGAFDICCRRPAWATGICDEVEDDRFADDIEIELGKFQTLAS